jgi:hypothetical protein
MEIALPVRHYIGLLTAVKGRLAKTQQSLPSGFDDDDKVIIHWYTIDTFADSDLTFQTLNDLMRTGSRSKTNQLWLLASYLSEALIKLPVKPRISYRVIRNYDGFLSKYKLANVVVEPSFLSSSRNPRVPFSGQVYFTLFGHSARFIGGMSEFLTEDEMLFLPQTQFKVLLVEHLADNTIHVVMKEEE